MVEKYIIDKTDIHDLLTGQELPLSQGKARAFCVEIAGELTNGELIKALFPNCEISEHKVRTKTQGEIVAGYDVFLYTSRSTKSGMGFGIKIFFDIIWWNSSFKAERS